MTQARLWVIEDNDNFRSALADSLRAANYAVEDFFGLEGFFLALERSVPDVILSDIELGHGDGFEMMARLQAMGLTIPVILMTGNSDPAMAQRARAQGACAFLQKPFESQRLFEALQRV